jgi:pyridoxal phosphate enzyme (YggS family)
MDELSKRYQAVRERITQAALQAGRNPDSVQLLVVSKTFGADKVSQVAALGQCDFGENYVQEGVDKISALQGLKGLVWHCIGPLQSNKTRPVAEHFDWVHSVDRLKIAQRLSEQRPAHLPPLQVCLQVNIDGGATKAGVVPTEALALAQAVAVLPRFAVDANAAQGNTCEQLKLDGVLRGQRPARRVQRHDVSLALDAQQRRAQRSPRRRRRCTAQVSQQIAGSGGRMK